MKTKRTLRRMSPLAKALTEAAEDLLTANTHPSAKRGAA